MIFVDAGNDRVVIGGSNVTAVSTFAVTYPQAKTDTTTRYVHLGKVMIIQANLS